MKVQGILIKETEKAYLLMVDKTKSKWVPKSQMSNITIGRCDQEIVATVPDWLHDKIYDLPPVHISYGKSGRTDFWIGDDDDDAYEMDHIVGTYFDQG